jgi:Domain of unknown function (DUF4410)
MITRSSLVKTVCLFTLVVLVGCAKTRVTEQTPIVNPGLSRPARILVYDFVADPADMPTDSSVVGAVSAPRKPQTSDQLATGRQLGTLIATNLVADIQAMGLSAVLAGPGSSPQVGDGVIRGYLISVQGGGAAKRFIIGFGSGASELDTVVEGYTMTTQGLRRLGSGTLSSSGGKTPGLIVPAAVAIASGNPVGLIVVGGAKIYREASGKNGLQARAKATANAIADELKKRFEDRGWV